MSNSTISIKRPINYRQSLAALKEKCKELSPILSIILWTFSGLYAASNSDFNTNVTGISLSFPVYNIILMGLSSLLLYKGLNGRNIILLLPWISVTIYTLYFNHYLGLLNILRTLKRVKKISWIPWSNLVANIILLIVRGTLMIRIFQLCVHLWFKKRLVEMKGKRF